MLDDLEEFTRTNRFHGKGALSVAIYITEYAKKLLAAVPPGGASSFPIDPETLLAESGTQVRGLNSRAVQTVLNRHGVERVLSSEAGRTNRGSAAKMRKYVEFLNAHAAAGDLDLDAAEGFWVGQVQAFFAGKPFTLKVDPAWGVRTSIRHLIEQAVERQTGSRGGTFLGTMMQHLVGAKLAVLLGSNAVEHHSANQSDQRPGRHGDFDIDDVAIHVTSAPATALARKCSENLGKGKRPIIVTLHRRLDAAEAFLDEAQIADRVDVMDFEQFMTANVFELGKFGAAGRATALDNIVEAYNDIIDRYETPSLRIEVTAGR